MNAQQQVETVTVGQAVQTGRCEVCGLPDPTLCQYGHRDDGVPWLRAMSAGQYIDILDGLIPRPA